MEEESIVTDNEIDEIFQLIISAVAAQGGLSSGKGDYDRNCAGHILQKYLHHVHIIPAVQQKFLTRLNADLSRASPNRHQQAVFHILLATLPYCTSEQVRAHAELWCVRALQHQALNQASTVRFEIVRNVVEEMLLRQRCHDFQKTLKGQLGNQLVDRCLLDPLDSATGGTQSARLLVAALHLLAVFLQAPGLLGLGCVEKIEEYVIGIFNSSQNVEIHRAAAVCLHFSRGIGLITACSQNWQQLFERICLTIHKELSVLHSINEMPGNTNLFSYFTVEPFLVPNIQAENARLEEKRGVRTLAYITCLQEMLRNKFSAEKIIECRMLFNLVQRGVRLNHTDDASFFTKVSLVEIQVKLLDLLQMLIALSPNVALHLNVEILQLITYCFKLDRHKTYMNNSNYWSAVNSTFTRFLREYRKVPEHVANAIVMEHMYIMCFELNKRIDITVDDRRKICTSSLQSLSALFKYARVSLSPFKADKLISQTETLLVRATEGDRPSPFDDDHVLTEVFTLLRAIINSTRSQSVYVNFPKAVTILAEAANEFRTDPLRSIIKSAMDDCEKYAHPLCPSMMIAQAPSNESAVVPRITNGHADRDTFRCPQPVSRRQQPTSAPVKPAIRILETIHFAPKTTTSITARTNARSENVVSSNGSTSRKRSPSPEQQSEDAGNMSDSDVSLLTIETSFDLKRRARMELVQNSIMECEDDDEDEDFNTMMGAFEAGRR